MVNCMSWFLKSEHACTRVTNFGIHDCDCAILKFVLCWHVIARIWWSLTMNAALQNKLNNEDNAHRKKNDIIQCLWGQRHHRKQIDACLPTSHLQHQKQNASHNSEIKIKCSVWCWLTTSKTICTQHFHRHRLQLCPCDCCFNNTLSVVTVLCSLIFPYLTFSIAV